MPIGVNGRLTYLLSRFLHQPDRLHTMTTKPVIAVMRDLHLMYRRSGICIGRPQVRVVKVTGKCIARTKTERERSNRQQNRRSPNTHRQSLPMDCRGPQLPWHRLES